MPRRRAQQQATEHENKKKQPPAWKWKPAADQQNSRSKPNQHHTPMLNPLGKGGTKLSGKHQENQPKSNVHQR
ncbi:hypothetical protein WB44_00695 [Synechococcus sp. WH 8020]|nr:hypothetical protein WB44_00695 [Synechococcus sp. WH 8020]